MVVTKEYQRESINLNKRVEEFTRFLNDNNLSLNELIHQLEYLFALFSRSDTLIKIIQEYSKIFKSDIYAYRERLSHNEERIRGAVGQISGISSLLEEMETTLSEIESKTMQFIDLVRSIEHLAENTEIRAYQAKEEGRGLVIIAREASSLASLSQLPFQDFSIMLNNLKDTARPAMAELEKIMAVSADSSEVLSRILESLKKIDMSIDTLEKLVAGIEYSKNNYNTLKKGISEKLPVVKEQLVLSLNTTDEMSTRCAEIRALAQLLESADKGFAVKKVMEQPFSGRQDIVFLLGENIRAIGKLAIGDMPSIFPSHIHKDVIDIVEQIRSLSLEISKSTEFGEELAASMKEVVHLQSRVESFFSDIQKILNNVKSLCAGLAVELNRIDELILGTRRIFSKIKTLSIFARLEQSRSVKQHEVISPVIREFARLGSETDSYFKDITDYIQTLKRSLAILNKEKLEDLGLESKIPDYTKLKVFFDDLVRVFQDKKEHAENIRKMADALSRNNEYLKRLWQAYEGTTKKILNIRGALANLLKQRTTGPAVMTDRRLIVKVDLTDEPLTLKPDLKTDMSSHTVISNFSTGLFQFGMGAEVVPGLCEDYTVSKDGTEYTFRIREGLHYANGLKLRIEDIKAGIIKALRGPNKNMFAMISGCGDFAKSAALETLSIKIIDNLTLKIDLEYPFLPILANLSTNIADPYVDDELPIGTGPFRLVSWEKGRSLTLQANEHYFEGRTAVDELQFIVIENEEEGYELFQKGGLSVFRPGGEIIERVKRATPELLFTTSEFSVQFLCLNCQVSPFSNRLVRKAVCHAVDVERLVRNFLEHSAMPARGIFPPSMRVYNNKLEGYQYDPGKSRQLLKEAGFPNGLPDLYPMDVSDSAAAIKRAEFIRASLADIGVRIEINPIPWHLLLDKTYKGNSIMSFQGWISDNGDPDNFVYPLFHSSSFGYTGNTFFFSSPKIDSDIEKARKIRNVSQRMAFYQNLETAILEEAPGVFLFHSLENIAIQKGLLGLQPHPLSLIRLKSIYRERADEGLPEYRFSAPVQMRNERVSSATGFGGS